MLRFVDKIALQMSLVDPASLALRSFYSRLCSRRVLGRNPKCVVQVNTADDVAEPALTVVYKDKKTITLRTRRLSADDIYREVAAHARKLKIENDIRNA